MGKKIKFKIPLNSSLVIFLYEQKCLYLYHIKTITTETMKPEIAESIGSTLGKLNWLKHRANDYDKKVIDELYEDMDKLFLLLQNGYRVK